MSAIAMAIEKVKQLDEAHPRQLLTWLQRQERAAAQPRPAGKFWAGGSAKLPSRPPCLSSSVSSEKVPWP